MCKGNLILQHSQLFKRVPHTHALICIPSKLYCNLPCENLCMVKLAYLHLRVHHQILCFDAHVLQRKQLQGNLTLSLIYVTNALPKACCRMQNLCARHSAACKDWLLTSSASCHRQALVPCTRLHARSSPLQPAEE